jgi:hypothetical protein
MTRRTAVRVAYERVLRRETDMRPLLKATAIAVTLFTTSAGVHGQGPGGPDGADILIRAENRSTADTPFCGVGAGQVGDRLRVDAFMDTDGVVTGEAVFEDANGVTTRIRIDRMFNDGVVGLAALVQNQANQNTVAIWMSDFLPSFTSPTTLVNVELPRGCGNTVSTFTPGVDKVTMEIEFR